MKYKLLNSIAERIYPAQLYCHSCGKIIDWSRPYGLCDNCMKNMRWAGGRLCDKCGKLLSVNNPDTTCYNCKETAHNFSKGYTCSEYNAYNRAMIYALKYDNKPAIARTIGEIMADKMLQEFSPEELAAKYDLIVPVPVSSSRLSTRGYNQAALIAEYFAECACLTYNGEILRRIKDTDKMKGLTPAERRHTIRGSFDIIPGREKSVRGSNCLIVDDIQTTGATADEVAAVLLENGAKNVEFLSFASGADVIKS